ncbi:MAG: formimidoylglutamase [Candidatus Parcubacteria bacterium]|nr:formimidoylglutamase [Candidatus Parcubacteria bacterium]
MSKTITCSFLQSSGIRFGGIDKNKDDPRFANMVQTWDRKSQIDIGIVGVPYDGGVLASGGRVGASLAPDAIRGQLLKYGTATNIVYGADLRTLTIADCGNVVIGKDITYSRVFGSLMEVLNSAKTAIVFGGGHDISYETISALSAWHSVNIGGANVDAHFDVRPMVEGKITSGTPFRRLIEGTLLSGNNFFEIGAQGHTNAKAHAEYLREKKATIIFLHEVRRKGIDVVMQEFEKKTKDCKALFVSIDIDAIASAFAPGSSAPSPAGLFPSDVFRFAYLAGQNPKVRLFEIMEMNPMYDTDERTARLAANIVLEFCAGRANKK